LAFEKTPEKNDPYDILKKKEKYKKLAEYIVHLIQDDPSSPK